jgi:hypothetical protein
VLKQREHRQQATLHADRGTVRFFRHHLRLAHTLAGRRALRFAQAELRWTRRELAETRAALRPRYRVPAWWLPGALCVHNGESRDWTIENPPYSGGMQMDATFQRNYGPEFLARYGSAGRWPVVVQLLVAYRGWLVQGWGAWPNTSRACGLR